ncbi:MAG: carbohydrate binding family 9 domain-containing protein [Bacteroidales bacterium]|nr:carbohydrate binding family 9 domain-containing protein [Bacteroidales bacterium]
MKRLISLSFIVLLSVCAAHHLIGQDAVKITRLSSPVEFDGYPYEEAWNNIEYFTLTQNRPNYGAEPSERSEIMIAYDDEFLWVGARLFMQDATQIVATSKKRDEMSRSSDSFGLIIDSFNDNENALAFFTMPTGARIDYTIANDATMTGGGGGGGGGSGGRGGGGGASGSYSYMNLSWNTFWDVETTRDDQGWYVEMRIPFSSLRFKPENDVATMGLIINRTVSEHNETDTYPAIDPKYGFTASSKPSLANDLIIEGARPKKPVYISPYVIGGFSRDWNLNTEEPGYVRDDNPDFNAGLDVKYSINSNLTLDLTVNTDFAQVEADNQQVNLTRYSLYFPEKRMFFQERSSLFSFSLGGTSNLFYSRDIGLSPGGEPIRIYGGARIVGRVGNWDVGLIDMQTEEHGFIPGENFGIFRMRRRVINENSYVGGIFTSRVGMNGDHNFAYGLDGIFRVYGDDYLDVKVAQTYDSELGNKLNSIDPMFFSVKWERRSEEGFAYELGYSYSGQEFDPGIGFVRQGSMQNISGNLQYGWLPGPESKFFSYQGNVRFSRYTRLEDGKLESMSIQPGWEMNTKSGYRYEVNLEYQEEGVRFSYPLSDSIWIMEGEYQFYGSSIRFVSPMSRPIYFSLNANLGEFYNGQRYGFSVTPYFNLSSSLQLSGSYQFNHIVFPDRETNNKLNIHSTSARVTYMLNTKLSASLFVQYVNTDDELIGNFRLRYNPREGNDFYLVYNEYRGVNNKGYDPPMPDYFNRTIMLKYTHTFRF